MLPANCLLLGAKYANLTIEGHVGVVTALKDPGAEISLVRAELVQDKNLPSVGSVVIRGILGEPIPIR